MSIIRPILRKNRDDFSKKISSKKIKTIYDVLSDDSGKYENAIDFLTKMVLRSCIIKKEKIANVTCFTTQPNFKRKLFLQTEDNTNKIFLYIHGGGFVGGCPEHGAYLYKKLMMDLGIKCIGVDYSLSPKKLFPTALNEIYNVYLELIKTHKPQNIFIGGESAGANLCMSLILKLKENKIQPPNCTLLSSGFFDLTCSNKTYLENDKSEVCLHPIQLSYMAHAYVAGESVEKSPDKNAYTNKFISPIYANLENFPPIFLSVCKDEMLYGDSLKIIENAQKYNVDITTFTDSNCFHAYFALGDFFAESKLVCDKAVTWLRKHLNIKKSNIIAFG